MSKGKSWRDDLPQINWQSAQNRIKVQQMLNGEPVAYLRESELYIPETGNRSELSKWAYDVFQKQGGKAEHPIIGEILLTKSSAKSSFAHGGANIAKKLAFYAIKDVCECGVIFGVDDADKRQRSYYIAAPVIIESYQKLAECVTTVLVHKEAHIQQVYLHSVIDKEYLLKPRPYGADNVRTSSRQHTVSLTSTDRHNLLYSALTVKPECAEQIDDLFHEIAPNYLDTADATVAVQSYVQGENHPVLFTYQSKFNIGEQNMKKEVSDEFKKAFVDLAIYQSLINDPQNEKPDFLGAYHQGSMGFNEMVDKMAYNDVIAHPYCNQNGEQLGSVIVLGENKILTLKHDESGQAQVEGYESTLNSFLAFGNYQLGEAPYNNNNPFLVFVPELREDPQELYKFQAHFFPSLMKGAFIYPTKMLENPTHESVASIACAVGSNLGADGLALDHRLNYLDGKTPTYLCDDAAKCINNAVGQDCMTGEKIFFTAMAYTTSEDYNIDPTPLIAETSIPDTKTIRANLREKEGANYRFTNHPFDPKLEIAYHKAMIEWGFNESIVNRPQTLEQTKNTLSTVLTGYFGLEDRHQTVDDAHALVALAQIGSIKNDVKAQALTELGIPMTSSKLAELATMAQASPSNATHTAERILPSKEQQAINLELQKQGQNTEKTNEKGAVKQ